MDKTTKRAVAHAENRAHILRIATGLFQKYGYEDVAMREIARVAKTSTGAIFGNWLGKRDLYREAIGRYPFDNEDGGKLLAALERHAPGEARLFLADHEREATR